MRRVAITYNCADALLPYINAISSIGLIPVPVSASYFEESSSSAFSNLLDSVDGLVLSGGIDVDSARYGKVPHERADKPLKDRDEMEWQLVAQALARDMPVFGICRGMQLLNCYLGGTLNQHLDEVELHQIRPPELWTIAHEVCVEPESILQTACGSNFGVNSRHHQAIDILGSDLRVVARSAKDHIVEAIEHESKSFVVGVQWHPENGVETDPIQRQLFLSFKAAVELFSRSNLS